MQPDTRVNQWLGAQPFDETPTDTPSSGSITLKGSSVTVLDSGPEKSMARAQTISESASLTIKIDAADAQAPCDTGIVVGTFTITFADGVVTSIDQSLTLSAEALALVVTNDFTMCLEMEANTQVSISIGGIDIEFGPSETTPSGNDNAPENVNGSPGDNDNDNAGGSDNVNDNADDNENDNTAENINDNADDNGNDNTSENVNDNSAGGCTSDSDCDVNEICTASVCVPGPVEPEFTVAEVIHVGSEQIIVGSRADEAGGYGFIPDDGYGVTTIAMSGDGQNMWFITYNEFAEADDDRQRLYFIQTDGTNLLRSAVPLDTITDGFNVPIINSLATNDDGLRAVVEARRNIPFTETASVFFDVIMPGLPASAIYDTLGQEPRPPVGDRRKMQMSDDGNFVSWSDETRIWRYPMNILNSAADNEFTVTGHACDNQSGDAIRSFDRTTVDVRTLFSIRAVEINDVCNTLILGSSQTSAREQDMSRKDFLIDSVHISDDGLLMAYCLFSGFSQGDPAPCFVQGVDGAADGFALTPTSDTWAKFTDIVLADRADRYRVVVTTNVFAPNGVSVFETPGRDDRRTTGTDFFGANHQSVSGIQLSNDGNVMAGLAGNLNSKANLYILNDGRVGLPGFPTIESITYRYDEETDALIFRVQVESDNGINLVQVYPMKNGIDPGEYLPGEENPFSDIRFGFGGTITPIEGSTNIFEQSVPLFGLRELIDDSFVLRIVVVDGARARTHGLRRHPGAAGGVMEGRCLRRASLSVFVRSGRGRRRSRYTD